MKVGGKEFPDIAWYYPFPLLDGLPVAGMIAFFNEKVDRLLVDGVEQPRHQTF